MNAIANRYEFVYLFDVENGNPNGDPDAGNLPRLDPETNQGLVSDVSLKRKVRNFIQLARDSAPPHAIYVQENAILNDQHRKAYAAVRTDDGSVTSAKALNPKNDDESKALQAFMCGNFYDIRTFGAVMSTGINCGQIRGPVQFAFGRSIEPIIPLEISITRMAATNEKEKAQRQEGADDQRVDNRTMGRKHIVPYGLYRAHGFVSAKLAEKTGFSDTDLDLLWQALVNMFDHDRSAARGEMAARELIVFRHDSALGNAPAHALFDRVTVGRANGDDAPARRYADYRVQVDEAGLPAGVTVQRMI
ncbi:type I-C CRISPR-associated protein Cas7/Csd2 [Minwuia thermotolerans]|uniref:Type I-C CRISPR-associated protein Cas7/Csd2 n=1 Tax=Minwuia thermotolerans TaxID=2056226 RepID=A0A2M9G0I0_9PROT|nr:type I-C CRISPR-associated protein Cas7/Csd2 [Minwuia thermotolerans]PJK29222.1 type I-C CRISPR-associated protein Cas7/Csd2 [Minwuia thermotolerans]